MGKGWTLVLYTFLVGTGSLGAEERIVSLFDGKSLDGWVTLQGQPITKGWEVVDGVMHLDLSQGRPGHIVTSKQYGDGELTFEWKIAKGGNSGIKYRVQEFPIGKGKLMLGCEYQLLDDEGHRNGRNPKTSVGALYGLYAPEKDKPTKPVGEWNLSKIVVKGDHIEHWLNGKKIVAVEIGSEDWNGRIAKSKFRNAKGFAMKSKGLIMLQDHRSEVWFRKIELRTFEK